MAQVPELSDDTVRRLLDRAATDPAAETYGLRPPGEDGVHWFAKRDPNGRYNSGDDVLVPWFRLAVREVIETRGNFDGRRDVADAYWDMVRNEPADWKSVTVLAVASVSVMLGVGEEIKGWN